MMQVFIILISFYEANEVYPSEKNEFVNCN